MTPEDIQPLDRLSQSLNEVIQSLKRAVGDAQIEVRRAREMQEKSIAVMEEAKVLASSFAGKEASLRTQEAKVELMARKIRTDEELTRQQQALELAQIDLGNEKRKFSDLCLKRKNEMEQLANTVMSAQVELRKERELLEAEKRRVMDLLFKHGGNL